MSRIHTYMCMLFVIGCEILLMLNCVMNVCCVVCFIPYHSLQCLFWRSFLIPLASCCPPWTSHKYLEVIIVVHHWCRRWLVGAIFLFYLFVLSFIRGSLVLWLCNIKDESYYIFEFMSILLFWSHHLTYEVAMKCLFAA